jgi:hypothetical protein
MSARITEITITLDAPGVEPFTLRAERNGVVSGGGHGMILNGKWHWSHGFGHQLPVIQREEPRIAALARSVFGEGWGT